MSFIYFFFLSLIIIFLSTKISAYVDNISKDNKNKGYIITGILLSGITSLPELITSITAVKINNPYLAIGDIFGSNAFNIFMICLIDIFFIKKMFFNNTKKLHKTVHIIMLFCYLSIYLFIIINPSLTLFGMALPTFVLLISYIYYVLKLANPKQESTVVPQKEKKILKLLICAIIMVGCSFLLTKTANQIADVYPIISGSVIGALLLGITTSLPEVITFITLIKLKNYDMALTGILGSNMFNLLVLAINDLIMTNSNIFLYVDYGTIILLRILLAITGVYIINSLLKKYKNYVTYVIPSIIVVLLYGIFIIKGLGK